VIAAEALTEAQLDHWWNWCRSTECGVLTARCKHEAVEGTLVPRLLQAITGH
jgi:hypothetical protein